MRFYLLLLMLLFGVSNLASCRKAPKTFDERLAEIQSDTKLSDEQAIEEFAYLCFRIDSVKVSAKGKDITAEIAFHGWDESRVAVPLQFLNREAVTFISPG